MFFRLWFVTLVLALVVLATPVKRLDAAKAKVERDIEDLIAKSKSLDKSIQAFPDSGLTVPYTLDIQKGADDLGSSLKTATRDVIASDKFTIDEASSIVQLLDKLVPIVETACSDLEVKKSAITNAHVAGIAASDLRILKGDADMLAAALSPKLPANMQNGVQKQFDTIDDAFASAITVYCWH